MKNRAKCKICNDVIESYHSEDHVICKCGEIECWGGLGMMAAARDFANFLRVDDEGNEIVVEYIKHPSKDVVEPIKTGLTYAPLERLIESYKRLPDAAMTQPVSNSDLLSVLESLLAAFKA